MSSLGPGPGHCPRLFSKTGLNSCLKRTRAVAIIPDTPTHHPPSPETFQRSGVGPGHCPRLFSKTGLNSCLKRTRAEAKITETPTHHHQKLFKDHVLGLGLAWVLVHYSNTKDSERLPPRIPPKLLNSLSIF